MGTKIHIKLFFTYIFQNEHILGCYTIVSLKLKRLDQIKGEIQKFYFSWLVLSQIY